MEHQKSTKFTVWKLFVGFAHDPPSGRTRVFIRFSLMFFKFKSLLCVQHNTNPCSFWRRRQFQVGAWWYSRGVRVRISSAGIRYALHPPKYRTRLPELLGESPHWVLLLSTPHTSNPCSDCGLYSEVESIKSYFLLIYLNSIEVSIIGFTYTCYSTLFWESRRGTNAVWKSDFCTRDSHGMHCHQLQLCGLKLTTNFN